MNSNHHVCVLLDCDNVKVNFHDIAVVASS